MEESYICLAETVSILFCCICCISYISVGDNKKRKENNRKVFKEKRRKEKRREEKKRVEKRRKEKRRKDKKLPCNPIYGHDMTHLLLCLVLSCLTLPYPSLLCLNLIWLVLPCHASPSPVLRCRVMRFVTLTRFLSFAHLCTWVCM